MIGDRLPMGRQTHSWRQLSPPKTAGTAEGGFLNLHEPGISRALLDEALTKGRRPDEPLIQETEGWSLFEDRGHAG